MNFIKKLWRGERCSEDEIGIQANTANGGKADSKANKTARNSTGSPRASPKHRGASPAGSPMHRAGNTTTVGVRTPTNRHVAQVLPGLLLGKSL